eukprot:CAMPEP_0202095032 /NCGR_PEP_ID=MMETSP0964-20121228/49339_1 /ASSEMBLY_ACC=CAM_ASM_000500 /TAXON_ID=4773 /ORGANISM="Schizochytrium aggregatum, Strain ATCC28209" /LENGTH=187 /DNA_ID=CAMNT_0048663285 /DNA_START=348 /DNA_END=911 /DNA_ORIENTATION=+
MAGAVTEMMFRMLDAMAQIACVQGPNGEPPVLILPQHLRWWTNVIHVVWLGMPTLQVAMSPRLTVVAIFVGLITLSLDMAAFTFYTHLTIRGLLRLLTEASEKDQRARLTAKLMALQQRLIDLRRSLLIATVGMWIGAIFEYSVYLAVDWSDFRVQRVLGLRLRSLLDSPFLRRVRRVLGVSQLSRK